MGTHSNPWQACTSHKSTEKWDPGAELPRKRSEFLTCATLAAITSVVPYFNTRSGPKSSRRTNTLQTKADSKDDESESEEDNKSLDLPPVNGPPHDTASPYKTSPQETPPAPVPWRLWRLKGEFEEYFKSYRESPPGTLPTKQIASRNKVLQSLATFKKELSQRPLQGVSANLLSLFKWKTKDNRLSEHFDLAEKIITRTALTQADEDLLSRCLQSSRWENFHKGSALDTLWTGLAFTAVTTPFISPVAAVPLAIAFGYSRDQYVQSMGWPGVKAFVAELGKYWGETEHVSLKEWCTRSANERGTQGEQRSPTPTCRAQGDGDKNSAASDTTVTAPVLTPPRILVMEPLNLGSYLGDPVPEVDQQSG